MILAVDPGMATFGWAIVTPSTGRVVDCGVLIQPPKKRTASTLTGQRIECVSAQAELVHALITRHAVTNIAAEEQSHAPQGTAHSKIGLGMSWGSLIGIAAARYVPLRRIPPKTWQRAVVGVEPGEDPHGAIDYERVRSALRGYLTDGIALAVGLLKKADQTHVLDAIGIGVFAAMRPDDAAVVAPRGTKRRRSR